MNFLDRVRRPWVELLRSEPGRRFQDRNEKHRQRGDREWDAPRVLKLSSGFAILVPGIIMIPAPGPGAIIVAMGLALIADEFRPVAVFLDRAELTIRRAYQKVWGQASKPGRAILVLLVACVCVMAAIWCWGKWFGI
jgi:uncharacterized protein (TIGR02611 family)